MLFASLCSQQKFASRKIHAGPEGSSAVIKSVSAKKVSHVDREYASYLSVVPMDNGPSAAIKTCVGLTIVFLLIRRFSNAKLERSAPTPSWLFIAISSPRIGRAS